MKITSRCGDDVVTGLNEALLTKAAAAKLLRTDKVRADTTVCVIEAMKVFTDIPAGLAGTIAEVLVKNGQPVEFGQPLYRIDPA